MTFTLWKNLVVDGGGIAPILYADFFFSRLAAHIDPISDAITRRFISLNLVFLSADKYYKDYIEAIEEDGNMDLPPKGNIINGYGLFSMFTIKRYGGYGSRQQSLDFAVHGTVLPRHLGFVRGGDPHSADCLLRGKTALTFRTCAMLVVSEVKNIVKQGSLCSISNDKQVTDSCPILTQMN